MSRKFWNWVRNDNDERILMLNGEISNETWFGDEITPEEFRGELNGGQGKVTVWINSPGGDCFAAAHLYEHREEADHKGLVLTLRALLAGLRIDRF